MGRLQDSCRGARGAGGSLGWRFVVPASSCVPAGLSTPNTGAYARHPPVLPLPQTLFSAAGLGRHLCAVPASDRSVTLLMPRCTSLPLPQGSGVISVVVFGLWGNFTSKWGMLSTAEESGSFDACECAQYGERAVG